ncbi:hypothetical protein [Nocardia terpenica]|uniref:Uncharacterized protein n=1 Tax=Nocardia terpenica TaxID=455432 RepID=A0A6G9Z5S4_9NOCA|nr:hypothetical protein [Nocardia terpenica]QIS20955.1 hypothetical protein F6W96_24185 [Nocardia terpenica]
MLSSHRHPASGPPLPLLLLTVLSTLTVGELSGQWHLALTLASAMCSRHHLLQGGEGVIAHHPDLDNALPGN